MNASEMVGDILRGLTPERLRALVLELAGNASESVSLTALLDALLADRSLGSGEAAWTAQLALRASIRQMMAGIVGMRYVEGDS